MQLAEQDAFFGCDFALYKSSQRWALAVSTMVHGSEPQMKIWNRALLLKQNYYKLSHKFMVRSESEVFMY